MLITFYAWAMMRLLPFKDLKLNNDISLRKIVNTPDDGVVGFIVEVYFHLPIELHAKFKEYPRAPQSIAPDADWFSGPQRDLAEKARHSE